MKYLMSLIAAGVLAITLTGCIVVGGDHSDWEDNDWKDRQRTNLQTINNFELQIPRTQVISRLGAPDFSEAFSKDDNEYRVLYYRTQHKHADGETSKDETTPLVFKNDKLIGWGEGILTQVSQH